MSNPRYDSVESKVQQYIKDPMPYILQKRAFLAPSRYEQLGRASGSLICDNQPKKFNFPRVLTVYESSICDLEHNRHKMAIFRRKRCKSLMSFK